MIKRLERFQNRTLKKLVSSPKNTSSSSQDSHRYDASLRENRHSKVEVLLEANASRT